MEKMELHILGCGSALPTARHAPTAQVLTLRGKVYMIDCGEGTQLQLRRSGIRFTALQHIFISHLHGDHCYGLPGIISTFDLLGRTADLHIHALEGLEQALRPTLELFCRDIRFKVWFHTFSRSGGETIHEDTALKVTTLPLDHRIPCCGFLFSEKAGLPHIRRDMIDFLQIPHHRLSDIRQGAGWTTDDGRSFTHEQLTTPAAPPRCYAYLSDTRFCSRNIPLVEGADLLFHESTFAETERVRAHQTGHSTALQAATFAQMAHVKKLVIGHFSQRYHSDTPLLEEARTAFENTILANEGLTIQI